MAIKIPIVTVFDNKGLKNASSQVQGFSRGVQSIAKGFAVAGAALGAFGTVAVRSFAGFDAALTKSTAIMGTLSTSMRKDMADAAREVAKTTTFSANEAAEAYFFLASAGLDAESSVAALPQVAKFAQAGMFDMAKATDLLTDAQSALGLVIKGDSLANLAEMTRLSDVLVKANTLANASVEQFSEALTTKAGAALKAVNKDVTEGVAVLAALADQGIKGANAGTQLSIVMRDLTTKAIKNKQAFEQAGIAVFDSAGNMNNLGDIIGDIETSLSGMSDETQKATLLQLGFSDKSLGSLQALLGTSDAIKTYEESLRSASGFTDDVAGKQLDTLTAQFALLKSALTDVFISVGQQLEPSLKLLIQALQESMPAVQKMMEALGGVLLVVVDAIVPLLDAVKPLATIFTILMNALTPIIEQAMPILIKIIGMAAEIVAKLAEALLPIVQALLPPLLKLIEALLPVLDIFVDSLIRYLIPAFNKLVEFLLPPLIFLIENATKSIESLTKFLGPLYTALKPVLDGLLGIAGIQPGQLRKDIVITSSMTNETRRMLSQAGQAGAGAGVNGTGLLGGTGLAGTGLSGGGAGGSKSVSSAKPSGPTGLNALLAEANANGKKVTNTAIRQTKLGTAGLDKAVSAWIATSKKPAVATRDALKRIAKNGDQAINRITKAYNKSAVGQAAAASAAAETAAAAQEAHNEMIAAQQAAAQAEADALAERERVYNSFLDSVKSTFAGIKNAILGAFDLTQLGGSTNAITRNMDKLLTRLRSFATNVTKLSGMGLDPALLQQVIAAGPLAGARLAQTLVAGGANALNSINAGFNEFGALSSQIAQTGTESLFNRQAQQTIYNIEVSGGVGSGATIGKAIVDAIKAYERTSGAVFQGA
jgi:TP901 family phage tail tape measure protein